MRHLRVQNHRAIIAIAIIGLAACSQSVRWPDAGAGRLVTAGGAADDHGTDVAIDIAGDIWVVGSFRKRMRLTATRELVARGRADGFVLRYAPTGKLRWATSFGGSGFNFASAVDAHPSGGVVVLGTCSHGCELPRSRPLAAVETRLRFVARIAANGVVRWVHVLPGDRAAIATNPITGAVIAAQCEGSHVNIFRLSDKKRTLVTRLQGSGRTVPFALAAAKDGAFAMLTSGDGGSASNIVAFDADGRERWRRRVDDYGLGSIAYARRGELVAALLVPTSRRCDDKRCWNTHVVRLSDRGSVLARSVWKDAYVTGMSLLPDGSPVVVGMFRGRRHFMASIDKGGAMKGAVELHRGEHFCMETNPHRSPRVMKLRAWVRGVTADRRGRIAVTGGVIGPTKVAGHAVKGHGCGDVYLWLARWRAARGGALPALRW